MARQLPNNTIATREEFFTREQNAWDALIECWSDLPENACLLPGAMGEWTVKDSLNHIAAWQGAATRIIVDLLEGRWARLGANTEKFNQQNYLQDQERSLSESRERLINSRNKLLQQFRELSDDQLLNEFGRQQIGWWAKWTTYGHYEEHLENLRRFRQSWES